MGRGIYYADIINTVSETYAKEILTPSSAKGSTRCCVIGATGCMAC